jgi:hypothetical protein
MSFRSYDLIRLVKEHGQVLTLRKASAGTYDPATGTITGSTNTDTTFKGYPYNYVLDQIDGTSLNQVILGLLSHLTIQVMLLCLNLSQVILSLVLVIQYKL